jgi:uncharacterized membrane protein YdjX (TVP38/TMEM64 family)
MSDSVSEPQKLGLGRYLPLIAVVVGAGLGYYFFRDYLSFQALADNREALLAFRDDNYVLTAALFILAYTLIVAFSLPGATIATLTGGFLFATFPGALFNITGATIGATAIFLAAQTSFGAGIGARLEGSPNASRMPSTKTNGRRCSSCALCLRFRSLWPTCCRRFLRCLCAAM